MLDHAQFKDYYLVLGSGTSPDTPFPELKRVYYKLLKEWHPDHRPSSTTNVGKQKVQSALEAWQVLSDSASKDAYDQIWRRQNVSSPSEQAEECRRQGNAHYLRGQAAKKEGNAAACAEAYHVAIKKYTDGISLTPQDARLWSNRALCHSAMTRWAECRCDAQRAVDLRQDYLKGWLLLLKSTHQEGRLGAALHLLEKAMQAVPGSHELLALKTELNRRGPHILVEIDTVHFGTSAGSKSARESPSDAWTSPSAARRSVSKPSVTMTHSQSCKLPPWPGGGANSSSARGRPEVPNTSNRSGKTPPSPRLRWASLSCPRLPKMPSTEHEASPASPVLRASASPHSSKEPGPLSRGASLPPACSPVLSPIAAKSGAKEELCTCKFIKGQSGDDSALCSYCRLQKRVKDDTEKVRKETTEMRTGMDRRSRTHEKDSHSRKHRRNRTCE